MQNKDSDDHSGDKASDGASQNGRWKLFPNLSDFWVNALEIGGGGISVLIAIMLDASGFHKIALCFYSIALACAFALFIHYLAEKTEYRHCRVLFWILMFVNIVFLVTLLVHSHLTEVHSTATPLEARSEQTPNRPEQVPAKPQIPQTNSGGSFVPFRVKRVTPLTIPSEGVSITFGNSSLNLPPLPSWTTNGVKDVSRFFGMGNGSMILFVTTNQAFLEFEYAPFQGMAPLKLNNNELTGLPQSWDCNTSSNALEIVDENLMTIFQLYYRDKLNLVCSGLFSTSNSIVFMSPETGMSALINGHMTNEEITNKLESLHLGRIFKYPSSEYPGVLEDQSDNLVENNTAKSGEYELLAPDVFTGIVNSLKSSSAKSCPAEVLIYPVNPNESAYSLAQQLKLVFWKGGYVIAEGSPPSNLPEIPGISCFIYGKVASDWGLRNALGEILNTTKSHNQIEIIPDPFPNSLKPMSSPFPIGDPSIPYNEWQNMFFKMQSDPSFTNSVVVLLIRPK